MQNTLTNQNYHQIEKIGEGLQAKVMKALDKKQDKHVALKIYEESSYFKNEIDCLEQMDHPNIIKMLSNG